MEKEKILKLKKRVKELREYIKKAQDKYYKEGKPDISDEEYDLYFDELVKIEKEHPELKTLTSPTLRVGSDLSTDMPKFTHTINVLSLDKVYTFENLKKFLDGIENKAVVLEEKIDGLTIVLYYKKGILDRAVTRGNGKIGNDVTNNIRTIKDIPLELDEKIDIVLRGELYIANSDFKKYNKENKYANARNLCAGVIKRKKSSTVAPFHIQSFIYEGHYEKIENSHFKVLSYLRDLGFRVNDRSYLISSYEDLVKKIQELEVERKSLDYAIDGLVIKLDQIDLREEIGDAQRYPRWAMAFKFEPSVAQTILKDITIQVGRTGQVTPMAIVDPVRVTGSTIKKISLHNQSYIDSLNLSINDEVLISKRGDVIPALEKVIKKNSTIKYVMPSKCPFCSSNLIEKGEHLFCDNEECPEKILNSLVFFASAAQMDIEYMGESKIRFLFNYYNVRVPSDLYFFDYDKLKNDVVNSKNKTIKSKYKDKSIANIKESLNKSKDKDWVTIISSLGLEDVGKLTLSKIAENNLFSFDSFLSMIENDDKDRLLEINQIGNSVVNTIFQIFNDNEFKEEINRLKEAGLTFSDFEPLNIGEEDEGILSRIKADDSLKDQVWCITGSFNNKNFSNREEIKTVLKLKGAKFSSYVNKSTTVLLYGDKAGKKLDKAKALGIRVVNEKEFLNIIGVGE